MNRYFGWAEEGNVPVNTQGEVSTNVVQGSFPGCTVTVYLAGTLTLATIYGDNLQPPTPLTNPFLASANGYWDFYAASGRYDVNFSGVGITTPFTLGDVAAYPLVQVGTLAAGATQIPTAAATDVGALALLTDQNRSLVVDTGTQWSFPNGDVYNVRDFGAVGDGVTDDSAAFTAVATALSTALSGSNGTLYVPPSSGTYVINTNLTVPSNILVRIAKGAIVAPTTGKTFTIAGTIDAPLAQIFGGAGTSVITGVAEFLSPHWWGALANDTNDDTTAIQAAINSAVSTKVPIQLVAGTYKITAQLNAYKVVAPAAPLDGFTMIGKGDLDTTIKYYGPSNASAIRLIAGHPFLARFRVLQANGTGWVSGIDYDGDAAIGRSTHGFFQHVMIDGNSLLGDGIALGRAGFQADQLKLDHVYITSLPFGSGIITLNGNALSTAVIAPTIVRCLLGITQGTTTNISVFGGDIDNCGVNFYHLQGTPLTVAGVRSETSNRAFFSGSGSASGQVTFLNYWSASTTNTRSATNGAIQSGQSTLTLSQVGINFVPGDKIVIAGAGPASANLSCIILGIISVTATTLVVQVSATASTTVVAAAITLDGAQIQPLFGEFGAGPYMHIDCTFGSASLQYASAANGPQSFLGCRWESDAYDPFGSVPGAVVSQLNLLTVFGCTSNGLSHKMRVIFSESTATAFTASATTPSVLDGTQFLTANAAPTTITDFIDGFNGQQIEVLVNDANTSIGGGNIKTSTGAAVAAVNGRLYLFRRSGGKWYSTGL